MTFHAKYRNIEAVAQVAKLVDAPASGAGSVKGVGVRVPSWAPFLALCFIRFLPLSQFLIELEGDCYDCGDGTTGQEVHTVLFYAVNLSPLSSVI